MFVPFRRYFSERKTQDVAARAAGSVARRLNRRRPTLESLETRNLLSFIGSEHQVSLDPHSNFASDNASSSNGTSVAVWDAFSSTTTDIWAQRFDQFGNPTGAPIQVDTLASDASVHPHVSMDSTGRFVVAWENDSADGSSIMMRYFSASGSPITGITRVSKPGSTDSNPDVAASNGSFVISWTHQLSATNTDIDAERFVISGGVPVGKGIFGVNTDTNLEDNSSVAMSPGGSFDIAYERQSSVNNRDIFASQYNGSGSFLRSVAVNVDGNDESSPSVSMDNSGNAVIAYAEPTSPNGGIYANRLSAGGSLSGRITVQNTGVVPSVALRAQRRPVRCGVFHPRNSPSSPGHRDVGVQHEFGDPRTGLWG